MKWMRCRQDGREVFGRLEGDRLAVHEGDLFDGAHATGEHIELSRAEWLTPCRAGQDLGAVEQLPRRGREERLGRPAEPL